LSKLRVTGEYLVQVAGKFEHGVGRSQITSAFVNIQKMKEFHNPCT